MKIAIDISPIVYGTGVSVYLKNLVKNLLAGDKNNEYVLFGGSLRRGGEIRNFLSSLKGFHKSHVFPLAPLMADILWNRLHIIGIENFVGKVDIFHSSDWTQAPSNAFKVTTIHDLIPFFYPESSHPRIVAVHQRRLNWVKKDVDVVIVPSETTALDAIRYGIDERKIRIISEAVDESFVTSTTIQIADVKKKMGINGKYLLAVGTSHRKNISGIISAFRLVKNKLNLKLVVVGELTDSPSKEKDILYLGRVNDNDRPALYSGAEAFLYPSFYEGFGLPILEAFSCKTPVVTSDFGSMKEVSGNASILVNPADIQSISSGIINSIKNKKILIKKGIERLKKYSWEKTAKETLKVYQEVN